LKKYLPSILLYSRLFFAFVILALTFSNFINSKFIVLVLMYVGVIADIFDGIIARKLNISTQNFRVMDTLFDLLFYFSILGFIISVNPQNIYDNCIPIYFILILEFLMYVVSLIQFGKFPSPHAILSKFWGLYIVVEFSLLILCVPGSHFKIALIFGLIVHIDRLFIYLMIKHWDHDIPSSYHAFLLRQGKQIKRNKVFNG
jgi:phosphatidylglycerophosphate synthase